MVALDVLRVNSISNGRKMSKKIVQISVFPNFKGSMLPLNVVFYGEVCCLDPYGRNLCNTLHFSPIVIEMYPNHRVAVLCIRCGLAAWSWFYFVASNIVSQFLKMLRKIEFSDFPPDNFIKACWLGFTIYKKDLSGQFGKPGQ